MQVTTSNNSTMATLFLLALLLLVSPAKAGFGASCINGWTKSEKMIEGVGAESDLSNCQQSTFGLERNNILLGGKGSAEIIGIDIGSGGEGCDGGDKCMKQCQALCCITNGCVYSSIKMDTKTTDYVVYKEEEIKYYCRMYRSGKFKDSDTQSTCYPPSKTPQQYTSNCEAIAFNGMGWSVDSYKYYASLSKDNTAGCTGGTTKRRVLLSAAGKGGVKIPSSSAIENSIAKAFKPFKAFKKSLRKETTGKKQCRGLKGIVATATPIIDSSC